MAPRRALFEASAVQAPTNPIDQATFAYWSSIGLRPAPLCSDAVFLRRIYLDLIGTLPTAREVRAFLADHDPQKRTRLVDHLLERPEFAIYWASRWADVLRVKAEFPINLWPNAAQAYHRWIYTAVRDNLPYDQFARTLLLATGSNFRSGPANFYRATQGRDAQALARVVALTFMGTRLERWPEANAAHLGAYFQCVAYKTTGEWKEEIVHVHGIPRVPEGMPEPSLPEYPWPVFVTAAREQDPRVALADWLIRAENPWFCRSIANRVWAWLLGRGVVHEPDDFRPDNPPRNPQLLASLGDILAGSGYDVKVLIRSIVTSQTYQLSSYPADPDLAAAEASFACYPWRRLGAEVLIDALNQITGTTETYTSAIPEPFTVLPPEHRAIAIPDGSITSAFLETFGRPPRDTGEMRERTSVFTPLQRLHLLNSSHVQNKLRQSPALAALLGSKRRPTDIITELYLTILSRPPSSEELATVHAYAAGISGTNARPRAGRPPTGGANASTAFFDTAWALINSTEFLFKH